MTVYIIMRNWVEDTDVYEVWDNKHGADDRINQLNRRKDADDDRLTNYHLTQFVVLK